MNYSQKFKNNIALWCSELRSGKWKQATEKLQNSQGHCCLGVACEIFIPKKKQVRIDGFLIGGVPRDQVSAPDWLKQINYIFTRATNCDLITLNDQEELAFDEIADCLEALFIHEVLVEQNEKT